MVIMDYSVYIHILLLLCIIHDILLAIGIYCNVVWDGTCGF